MQTAPLPSHPHYSEIYNKSIAASSISKSWTRESHSPPWILKVEHEHKSTEKTQYKIQFSRDATRKSKPHGKQGKHGRREGRENTFVCNVMRSKERKQEEHMKQDKHGKHKGRDAPSSARSCEPREIKHRTNVRQR